MAGTIVSDTIQNGAGATVPTTTVINGSAKAWVNFSGIGSTTMIASFNVSSVTYNAYGSYTLNFTNSLSDANYAFIGSARATSVYYALFSPQVSGTKTTSALGVNVAVANGGSLLDSSEINVAIFR
jgi:hypothetical protein